GKCVNCAGSLLDPDYPTELAHAAVEFLDRLELPISPRLRWPQGFDFEGWKGSIRPEWQATEGRTLCHWGDPGYGELVRTGKQQTGRFDDQLVEASARLIDIRWRPRPRPEWVSCIPSRNRPTLVADFARRLAARLELPFVDCIAKVRD